LDVGNRGRRARGWGNGVGDRSEKPQEGAWRRRRKRKRRRRKRRRRKRRRRKRKRRKRRRRR
jgi:hypothetical protein